MNEVISRFAQEVESKLPQLRGYSVEQIAHVSYGDARWPILCVRSTPWEVTRPTVLISGGCMGMSQPVSTPPLDFLPTVNESSTTCSSSSFSRASTLAVSTQARSRPNRAPI